MRRLLPFYGWFFVRQKQHPDEQIPRHPLRGISELISRLPADDRQEARRTRRNWRGVAAASRNELVLQGGSRQPCTCAFPSRHNRSQTRAASRRRHTYSHLLRAARLGGDSRRDWSRDVDLNRERSNQRARQRIAVDSSKLAIRESDHSRYR